MSFHNMPMNMPTKSVWQHVWVHIGLFRIKLGMNYFLNIKIYNNIVGIVVVKALAFYPVWYTWATSID